ncbi:MAG: tRNA pseudouridine(55) synthase TruB [Butyricicoccus sp.]|nr:tRNA pseudouridine(55) synthase TruB [Butyricicoccus pullicaecorum]
METSGILIFNKPPDFTSHDVVAKLRGILRTRKIGHGGTLDPMATGVLPIFVGGATKAADYAAAQDKEYLAGFTLGFATDTQDTTGQITARSEKRVQTEQVKAVLDSFLGEQQQIPPMYSAVKIGGHKLYDLARSGKTIERPARAITILEIALCDFDEQTQQGTLRVVCSKGTYVRTIVHDLGERLGTYAAMHALTRIRSGSYTLEGALSFEMLETARDAGTLNRLFLPTDTLFSAYPAVSINDEGNERALRGATVFERQTSGLAELAPGTLCRVYYNGVFCLLGRIDQLDKGGKGLFVHKNFR